MAVSGTATRSRPPTAIIATEPAIAQRGPIQPATYAAAGAKSPMQTTGIEPRRPATVWEMPRSD